MGEPKKENESLLTSSDVANIENVFSLAIKGAGTNRVDLNNILAYEDIFKLKLQRTLKVLEAKVKTK